MTDDKPYAEVPLLNRGERIACVDPETGRVINVGYVKEWRSVNNVCTITTVASLDDIDLSYTPEPATAFAITEEELQLPNPIDLMGAIHAAQLAAWRPHD
jgi:hypothetical protein